MNKKTRITQHFQMNKKAFCFACLVSMAFRIALVFCLYIYFIRGTYDDEMQINKALSVASGAWLGSYNSMTLVKGVGFPLISAFFHLLHMPYVLGWQLFYLSACVIFVVLLARYVKDRNLLFVSYLLLLFNPISFSTRVTRLYRDIGYYGVAALTVVLFFALVIEANKKYFFVAFSAGFFLGLSVLIREDSQWLYLYAAGTLIASFVFLVIEKTAPDQTQACPAGKPFFGRTYFCRLLCVLVGFFITQITICSVNYIHYKTFVTDEYNFGSYAEAYGALTRLNGEEQDPHIAITKENRLVLYEHSETFASLYEVLDTPDAIFKDWRTEQGGYRAGYFSFVLRDAAATVGAYDSAQASNEFFTKLAQEVNAYCDEEGVPACGERHTVVARLYPWMIKPIFKVWFECITQAVRFSGISPEPVLADEDDQYLKRYEDFTYGAIFANRTMENGTTVQDQIPLWREIGFKAMRAIILCYRFFIPFLFVAALGVNIYLLIVLIAKKKNITYWRSYIGGISLLCAFLARTAMLAFVHVAEFPTADNPAYQAACYPLILLWIVFSFAQLCIYKKD